MAKQVSFGCSAESCGRCREVTTISMRVSQAVLQHRGLDASTSMTRVGRHRPESRQPIAQGDTCTTHRRGCARAVDGGLEPEDHAVPIGEESRVGKRIGDRPRSLTCMAPVRYAGRLPLLQVAPARDRANNNVLRSFDGTARNGSNQDMNIVVWIMGEATLIEQGDRGRQRQRRDLEARLHSHGLRPSENHVDMIVGQLDRNSSREYSVDVHVPSRQDKRPVADWMYPAAPAGVGAMQCLGLRDGVGRERTDDSLYCWRVRCSGHDVPI